MKPPTDTAVPADATQERPVFVAWSAERGFYYSDDGAYIRRQDYERILAHRDARLAARDDEIRALVQKAQATSAEIQARLAAIVQEWRETAERLKIEQGTCLPSYAERLGHRIDVYTKCANQLAALQPEDAT